MLKPSTLIRKKLSKWFYGTKHVMYKSSSKKTECFGALRMHKHLSIHNVVVVQEIFEHILLTVVANAFSLCKNQGMLWSALIVDQNVIIPFSGMQTSHFCSFVWKKILVYRKFYERYQGKCVVFIRLPRYLFFLRTRWRKKITS